MEEQRSIIELYENADQEEQYDPNNKSEKRRKRRKKRKAKIRTGLTARQRGDLSRWGRANICRQ